MRKKQKLVSRFQSERDRYVEAARLVYVHNLSVVEALNEVGICKQLFVEVAKQAAWPINENWSEWFKQESRVNKLLYMAELV